MMAEACYSTLLLFDRWALQLRSLAGEPLPEVPELPGRRFVAPEIPSVEQDAAALEAEAQAAAAWSELASDDEGATCD